MATLAFSHLTVADYLQLSGRHEYDNGEVLEMEASTQNHNNIAINIISKCKEKLKGTSCRVNGIEVPVEIPSLSKYVMPDAVVHCGPLDRDASVIKDPAAIFEVLSPGTEGYDRGRKWELYQTIPSLLDYLLVAQDRKHVEHFQMRDGIWVYQSLADEVLLSCLSEPLAIEEFYAGVDWVV